MNKVFFDLEWNTGFLDGNSFDEIIEIGAVKTDEEYRQIDGFRRLIRPVIYRKMNPYIQKILAITMKDLRDADPLGAVAKEFFDWCGDCDTLIAWSSNDFGVLEKNLAHIDMSIPESLGRYDVQMAYAYRTEKSIRNYALKTAVEAMELPEPEDQAYHDAYFDAQFTAAIGTDGAVRSPADRGGTAGTEKHAVEAEKAQAAADVQCQKGDPHGAVHHIPLPDLRAAAAATLLVRAGR